MSKQTRLLPLITLSVFLLANAPAVYGSTLHITLNPTTKVADIASMSTTNLVFTYPANSSLSNYLRNYSSSVTWSGTFKGDSEGAIALQGSLEAEDQDVHVQSMNVTYTLKATGNDTAFVVNKETDISALVTGVFKIENGTVKADLDWKAFRVASEMNLNLGNRIVEVNYVGSTYATQLSDHPFVAGAMFGMFGGDDLWHRPTLDFSSLNSNLSTWTKNYNSVTNTTTFSKTINAMSSFNASANFNGQVYTLSVKSDPSADISVQGYAVASGNGLVIVPTPLLLTPAVWIGAGAVAVAAIGGAFYMLRRRSPFRTKSPTVPSIAK